jgi:hypothetical protein
LRLFRDTLRVLMEANANNGDAIEMLHAKVGWRRLVEAQPSVEAMVAEKVVNPLLVAARHHAGLRKYAPRFLAAFEFRTSRRGDPVLAGIELLTQMHRENRRALPNKFPIGHLDESAKKLILAGGKSDRPLYEVATLGALRDRLRSGDIWVEGSRAGSVATILTKDARRWWAGSDRSCGPIEQVGDKGGLAADIMTVNLSNLSLPHHRHGLEARQRLPRGMETAEAEPRPDKALDTPVVLLDDVVQIFTLSQTSAAR